MSPEKRIIVKQRNFSKILLEVGGEADYFTFLTINYNDFGFLLLNLLIYLVNILSTSFQLCAIKPSTTELFLQDMQKVVFDMHNFCVSPVSLKE